MDRLWGKLALEVATIAVLIIWLGMLLYFWLVMGGEFHEYLWVYQIAFVVLLVIRELRKEDK